MTFFCLFISFFYDKMSVKQGVYTMKKIMNKVSFAVLGLMLSVPAFAEDVTIEKGMCDLLTKMHGVFNILRIAAFMGAAFYIAGWAWEFISKGEAKMDDVTKRGKGLLVGFGLLFIIGAVLSFLMSANGLNMMGCDVLKKW